MVKELEIRRIAVSTEQSVRINYKGFTRDEALRYDLLVENCLLVEVKAVEKLIPIHKAQLLSYMRLLNVPLGLLLNFHEERLVSGISRLILPERICPLVSDGRRRSTFVSFVTFCSISLLSDSHGHGSNSKPSRLVRHPLQRSGPRSGFYSAVLMCEIQKHEGPGFALGVLPHAGQAIGGCLVAGTGQQPSDHGILVYLNCDGRLDDAVAAVVPQGGKVVTPAPRLLRTGVGRSFWTAKGIARHCIRGELSMADSRGTMVDGPRSIDHRLSTIDHSPC